MRPSSVSGDLSRRARSAFGRAVADYRMIEPNDSILLGISGGKDSLLLALGLARLRERSPVPFSLRACLIDGTNGEIEARSREAIEGYLAGLGIPLEIFPHPTLELLRARDEPHPCGLCARLRRGILANRARAWGCGVLALGHHKDDLLETALLNLFLAGRFRSFSPNLWMSRSGIRVIRPLVLLDEAVVAAESERLGLPVMPSACPYGRDGSRGRIGALLRELGKSFPDLRANLLHALSAIRPEDRLDYIGGDEEGVPLPLDPEAAPPCEGDGRRMRRRPTVVGAPSGLPAGIDEENER